MALYLSLAYWIFDLYRWTDDLVVNPIMLQIRPRQLQIRWSRELSPLVDTGSAVLEVPQEHISLHSHHRPTRRDWITGDCLVRIFRTLFYLPSMVPAVASALLWQWVFNADNGILNQILGWFGLPNIEWLQNEKFTLWAFVIMSLWGIGGQRMIIFLAGLQGIPDSYYEAARLDGAGTVKQFWYITLPSLSPVMFFNLVLGLIGAFQIFTSAYIMTSGGPNNASLFYSLYIFRNAFEYFKMGKASAMAWILFTILMVFTLVQMALSKRWVHYEGEHR